MTTTTGFLKFNKLPPRLYVTGDDDDFDPIYLQHLEDEGFHVSYVSCGQGGKAYRETLKHLADDLELGERYAIIGKSSPTLAVETSASVVQSDTRAVCRGAAFEAAAAECLEVHIKPQPKLAALVAYYPTALPTFKGTYPAQLSVLCHVAASQPYAPTFKSYKYAGTQPGFAEHDADEFNKVAASLAWTRTLGTLRRALEVHVDLEAVHQEQLSRKHSLKDADGVLQTFAAGAHVTYIPTLVGGIGSEDLLHFYRDYFVAHSPPSLNMKLVSRTHGTDRVVDEMVVSFKHTHPIPWMLPDVPPTNKLVHVAVVSIVGVRGGKLCHEHIYWDQASVLVQIGALTATDVPEHLRQQGLKRLPVMGAEPASKLLDEESQPSNRLLSSWKQPGGPQQQRLANRSKQTAAGKKPST